MDSLPTRSYEAKKRQATVGGRKNRMRPSNLREQINPEMCHAYTEARMEANGLWPTVTASDYKGRGPNSKQQGLPEKVKIHYKPTAVNWWNTPTKNDGTNSSLPVSQRDMASLVSDIMHRENVTEPGSMLNPDWVEWLMGFPIGWTSLHGYQEQVAKRSSGLTESNASETQ
jgi:hypothetical protein